MLNLKAVSTPFLEKCKPHLWQNLVHITREDLHYIELFLIENEHDSQEGGSYIHCVESQKVVPSRIGTSLVSRTHLTLKVLRSSSRG